MENMEGNKMKISARLFWAIIICILFFAKGCSVDTPTAPEKEIVIVTQECDGYIRATKHNGYWTGDGARIFTYNNYINFMDDIDELEQVGIVFINWETDSVFYVGQGGFYGLINSDGYAYGKVTTAEAGDSLYVYSYVSADSIPDGVRDITWVNLEWSNDIPFDSVKAAVNRNHNKLGKGLVEKKIGLWKGKEWLEH